MFLDMAMLVEEQVSATADDVCLVSIYQYN